MQQNSKFGDAYAYAFLKVIYKDWNFSNCTYLVTDMLDFCSLFNSYPIINEFLSNPIYDVKKKKQFLNDLFSNYLNPLLINFLNLLCETKRVTYISSILNVFLNLLLKSTNSHIIEIEVPINDNYKIHIDKLNIILSLWFLKTKKDPQTASIYFECFKAPFLIYKLKQNSNLLGGFKLNFITESKIIDFSIMNKIQKISKILGY